MKFLTINNKTYIPKNTKIGNKPLWVARKEKEKEKEILDIEKENALNILKNELEDYHSNISTQKRNLKLRR